MSTLADNIRKAALNKTYENQPQGTNTQDLQTQLGVGATGKGQNAGQNLKQSNIAEQIGMVDARAAQEQVEQQGLDAASDIAAKEAAQAVRTKQVEAANRTKEMEQKSLMADRLDDILSSIKYSEAQLEDRYDAMQLEQAAATLRLSEKKYISDLKDIAARNNIRDMASMKAEAIRLAIGQKTSLLYQDLSNQYELNELRRADTWKEAKMNLDHALKVAEATIADQTKAMQISAVKDLGQAAWTTYQSEFATSGATETVAPTAEENVAQQSLMNRGHALDQPEAVSTTVAEDDPLSTFGKNVFAGFTGK